MRCALLVVVIAYGSLVSGLFAQFEDPDELLVRLQSPATTDTALREFAALSKNDIRYKVALSKRLPLLMSKATNDEVLSNDSQLAGDLKLDECIPELLSLYMKGDEKGGMVTLSIMAHLANDPAGLALVKIGDPAIVQTKTFMKSQQEEVRARAIRVLVNIGSPSAKAALQEQRAKEDSPQLQRLIDSHITQ